jgi:hypothetical protein
MARLVPFWNAQVRFPPFFIRSNPMSEREPTAPVQNQDDELDVEELEEASGGGVPSDSEVETNNGCNQNCPCIN